MYWPNGRICWEINSYLISLRKRRRAVSTINTYCAELSSFVRFLGLRSIPFADVSDDTLVDYSVYLVNGGGRSGSQINRLLARAIKFLEWLQWRLPVDRLVGLDGDGAAITVECVVTRQRSRLFAKEGLRHHSFVPGSVARVVRPLAPPVIRQLFDACSRAGHRSFIRARNSAMLKLLEGSGVRREELVHVKVDHIRGALNDRNLLAVRSSKKDGNPYRKVPVPSVTLRALIQYLDVQRTVHFAGLSKRGSIDQGWAFCKQTGEQMAAATVTQIFAQWRRIGGIKERASPHMLRHGWITKQLAEMLRSAGASTPLGRELLVTFLTRLAERSGHASIESMFGYVDFAYLEMGLPEQKLEDDKKRKGWEYGLTTLRKLVKAAEEAADPVSAELFRSLLAAFEAIEPHTSGEMSVAAHSVLRG
ncbi:tyrosine-type recombinase/integrase [Cupriavidus pauculus]|uniref:tyrosine-type recombinase/integrase n=1 Tax=Cupriavidus pauculus TaxID=82633 RepID=UPI0038577C2D